MFRFVVVLSLICVLAALVLGVTYNTTRPLIAAQKELEKQLALEEVLPEADDYRKDLLGEREYYRGYLKKRLIGYVITAENAGRIKANIVAEHILGLPK